jgi:hypothetical protein
MSHEELDAVAERAVILEIHGVVSARVGNAVEQVGGEGVGRLHEALVARSAEVGHEPSRVYLAENRSRFREFVAEWGALSGAGRWAYLRGLLFPPVRYMRARYGKGPAWALPALYAWRMLAGAWKWVRPRRSRRVGPPRPTV